MDPAAAAVVLGAILSTQDRIKIAIENLPVLEKDDVHLADSCPICLMPFESIFVESRHLTAEAADPGVTKIPGCGHVFCRKDLCDWIRSQHGSCPTCRHLFLNIKPPSDSDDESSDGGEYIPPEDLEEEEDGFFDTDGFSEADAAEFDVEEMDLDLDDIWDDGMFSDRDGGEEGDVEMDNDEEQDDDAEWGLTDGESESTSSTDGDVSLERGRSVAPEADVNVSVHEDDDVDNENTERLTSISDRLAQEEPK